ncbi:hypothetical protein [Stenotrophomonas mori]|uniref:Transmembrane protein n=1 Tax=Stenotrophomonas mori TaxID=2871096 RepID=A0ABT0SFD2_9GAMM|nr:hypothetical protein [Stenotrophomonas mori]MCL7713962.1 hypothetical protein [Stenotrophomonas mori]
MILFLALCFVGVAIAGFSALLIFWPLTLIHIRDRHPGTTAGFGPFPFLDGKALRWLVCGHYRALGDRSLSGLATPARIALVVMWLALGLALLLWLYSQVMK